MINSLRQKTALRKNQDKKSSGSAGTPFSAREYRQRVYEYISMLGKKGWKAVFFDKTEIQLEKRFAWNWKLFTLGLVTLPVFGLGFLIWLLVLADFLLVRHELRIKTDDLKAGVFRAQSPLTNSQKILMGGFAFFLVIWLLLFAVIFLPGNVYKNFPAMSAIHVQGQELVKSSLDKMLGMFPPAADPVHAAVVETATPSLMAVTVESYVTPTRTPLMPLDATRTPTQTSTPTPTLTPTPIPDPNDWMNWPVIPEVSERAHEIYHQGLEMGNNPNNFSIVGDCQSMPYLFMGVYMNGNYDLGEDTYLQETIDQFHSSFGRYGMTIIDGSTAATHLAKGWANRNWCQASESPLDCELRLHQPSILFVHVGTHWSGRNEDYLRQIVETAIDKGALPIMVTKADNLEGDRSINHQIVQVAVDYDIPLWNFWGAVQDLSIGGLDPYRQGGYMYLTSSGLIRHRSTALNALDAVWKAVR